MKSLAFSILVMLVAIAFGARAEDAAAEITAKVLAVRNDVGLVMLSAGSNPKIGYQFEIWKNKIKTKKLEST